MLDLIPGVSKLLSGIKIGGEPRYWLTLPSVYTGSVDIPAAQGDLAVSTNPVDNLFMKFVNENFVQVYLRHYVSQVGRVKVDRYLLTQSLLTQYLLTQSLLPKLAHSHWLILTGSFSLAHFT